MYNQKDSSAKLTFDFDASFLDAKDKIVNLSPTRTTVLVGDDNDTTFKNSFLQVFDVQIKESYTSPRDHFVMTKSLDVILPPLLERYYLNNELVTAADLVTYGKAIDWFRDIWEIITTANIKT